MKIDQKLFLTAGGTITADPRKAATVFLARGANILPVELQRWPELGAYIPEIREAKEKSLASAAAADEIENNASKAEKEKNITAPADKRAVKPPNKAGGKKNG